MNETPDAARLRVMVVDDSVEGAQTLCMILEAMGCATSVAFDGPQALSAAARFHPHLAFIDLELPGMSGCDVVRHLRCNHPDRLTWLVCLTGRGQPEDERQCLGAGFDAFIRKPIGSAALSDVLGAANARLRAVESRQ